MSIAEFHVWAKICDKLRIQWLETLDFIEEQGLQDEFIEWVLKRREVAET